MFRRLLTILYAIEFLIALVAVFVAWSEVGGQGHLDFMAWYWKAGIGLPAAYGIVRLTVAWGSEEANRKTRMIRWCIVLAVLSVCAGLLTYYYHLNEPQDEDEAPVATTPAVYIPARDSGG
jgi:hypothetical protein